MDRRIIKSQVAIKKAFIDLMTEMSFDNITIQNISDRANVSRGTFYLHYIDKFDLLDKLIASHLDELQAICKTKADFGLEDALLRWTVYFENNYLFFSTILTSKGAYCFSSHFLEMVKKQLRMEINFDEGINRGVHKDIVYHFLGSAITGLIEWWFINKRPVSSHVLAEQLSTLLERNL
ncbi:TetR/AcrR family transcriptional regulator [Dehalobacterium formicoaceticum]|uniref:TetR/AcrR family transcriptional regulator n=1 Tax=Dehalobacterium formicoaceticum TaxID=51515 RepID=UPI000B800A29|nr:TetR/AcrR family transcriptional regulator [Dehalobacterium formicoaceticum]